MAVKIPQDVTREDRLVGPLTLRQFLFLLGGGSLIFIIYQYYAQQWLFFVEFAGLSVLIAGLTFAFAFANINGLPFAKFMSNFFRFAFSPKQRLWNKEEHETLDIHAEKVSTQSSSPIGPLQKSTNQSQLELLAQVLDTGGKMNENPMVDTDRIGTVSDEQPAVEEPVVQDILEEVEE